MDSFDYKEPSCALCGGKEFYNPELDLPDGNIPLPRIIEKVDALFNKNNFEEAGKLLEYWKNEAIALKDKKGELSITSELVGYYRKIGDKENTLKSIERALELLDILDIKDSISGATVFLNCATGYKAFNLAGEAIPLYERAENSYVNGLKEGDERFGGLYNNMALALVDLGEFDRAISYYFKAIKVMENVEGGKADLAITYINLAHLYEQNGKIRQTQVDCLFKAYELLTSEDIKKNGYYAYVLSKCAPSFEYFGFDKIAEEFNALSKEIYERS